MVIWETVVVYIMDAILGRLENEPPVKGGLIQGVGHYGFNAVVGTASMGWLIRLWTSVAEFLLSEGLKVSLGSRGGEVNGWGTRVLGGGVAMVVQPTAVRYGRAPRVWPNH